MRILVLSTWFPYPPHQGSTIRAYHLIQGLAAQAEVALISFEDRPLQPEWVAHMRQVCARVDVVHRQPFAGEAAKRRLGLLSLEPSAVFASRSPEMAERVRQVAAEWSPDLVFALTFVTAPYALLVPGAPRVVDVDNLTARMLYESYQAATRPLDRLRRYLAYAKFRRYESRLFRQFDLCLIVSERDRRLIGDYVPLQPRQIGLVPNGVALEYYRPQAYPRRADSLVYSGALTYQANLDAMEYFLGEIFPAVTGAVPAAELTITGSTTGIDRERLPAHDQVRFTGYVDDVRPYVGGSTVCVVPLRQGAGTRLKILEAMALGTPVVSTNKGVEGLALENGRHVLVADTPAEFAAATVRLLRDPALRETLAGNARQRMEACYGWDQIQRDFAGMVGTLVKDNHD